MNDLGKPCAGEPHARFDEGGLETEPWSRDRSACSRLRGQRRTFSATAPVPYSTLTHALAGAPAGVPLGLEGSPALSNRAINRD
jgi:hypothetical protein